MSKKSSEPPRKKNIAGRGSDQFPLRLPEGMRDRIKAAAEQSSRSMNAEIVKRLERTLAWDQYYEEDLRYMDALKASLPDYPRDYDAQLHRDVEADFHLNTPRQEYDDFYGPHDPVVVELDEVSKAISDATNKAVAETIRKLQKRGLIRQQPPELDAELVKARKNKG